MKTNNVINHKRAILETFIKMADGSDEPNCDDYTSRTLGGVLNCVRSRNLFMYNNVFRNVRRFDTLEIQFDKIYDNDQDIPFVCPCDQAPYMDTAENWESTILRPAYVKAKAVINCCEPMKRLPGEYCWGQFTERQRFELKLQEILRMLERAIQVTEEKLMWKSLIHGKYTIEGENYPSKIIDFKRDEQLNNIPLKWGNPESCDVLDELQEIYDVIMQCSGAMVDTVIAGPKFCRAIKKNKYIRELLCKCTGQNLLDMDMDITPRPAAFGVRPEFRIGNVDFWCSTAFYTCKNGNKKEKNLYLPENGAIFLALGDEDCGLNPMRLYGAIRDCGSLRPEDRFVKTWEENDPSELIAMIQAAPLPAIICPDASAYAEIECE